MDNHEEEAYSIINRPLSYAIACNIFDTEEAREDAEFMDLVVQLEERGECGNAYAAREDPEDLIKEFVRTLQVIGFEETSCLENMKTLCSTPLAGFRRSISEWI